MASAAVTKPVGGGVIYAELNCLISISNTTLQDIQSNGFGGAILLTHSSSMRANEMISNNTFSGGKLGGFMTALQGSTISCSWCLISNSGFKYLSALNSGEGQGGAFTILSSSSIFMQYSNISSSFGILGGAVAILSDSFGKFVYTNFIGNSATTASGAVAVFQSTALFDHVLFENNSAFIEGGALTLEIWDGYLYKAAFIGPVTFINNIVLDPLAGYGGAISMDTQSRLEINTTQLVMKGNKAAIGDAILCSNYFWGISNGTISYNPPASEVQAGLYPSIEGVIYLSQSAFALYTFENNPFIGVPGIVFDSPPATLAFANESITTKSISSSIGFDLVIPLIQIQLSNLFGNPIETINFTDPYIVKMIISSSSGSVLATFYKGILKAATPVKFQNIDLRNLTLPNSFDGVINLTFSLIHPLAEAVTFTLQPPDPPSSSNLTAMQIINAQVQQITRNNGNSSWSIFIPQCEIGTIAHEITPGVYKCVPLLTTMQSSLIVSGSLSGIFIVLTAALGVYAFSFKDIMVYRVKSSFFTVIITIGCLVQLISVLIRSFPSSAQCMASEWLELTGFMAVGASMWLKTYRIQLIILDPLASMAKTYVLKNAVLGMGVALGLFVSSMFLVAWTMIENISMSSVYVSSGSGGSANGLYPYGWIQTDRCKSSNGTFIFPIASACIHVALEIALLYIAYVARRVMPLYNESRSISIVATVWLVCTIVFVAVELQVALLPDTLLAIQVVRIILPVVTTVILLHIPSALKVLMDPLGPLVNLGKLFSENLTDLSSQSYQTSDAASSTNAKFAATGVDYAEKYQVAKVAPTRVHVKKPPKIHSIGNASEISADSKEPPPPHY